MRKKRLTPKEASARSTMAAVSGVDNKVVTNSVIEKTVVQYNNKEIDMNEISSQIKEKLNAEGVTVTELTMYVKPEDNAVYYVVNNDITGKYDI